MANHVKLKSLTENFQCGICQGYIIDATTISECLHSFCKSCIFHFIESIDHRCPTCNQNLTDLDNCISFDASLQRLIYQLVPNLLDNELERREQFQQSQSGSNDYETILNENTLLNLKLYNIDATRIPAKANDSTVNDFKENKFQLTNSNENIERTRPELVTVKYIQCIGQTPIRIIVRMLRNKYNIPPNYEVRISCMGYRISEKETLLKLFTCFIKTKDEILELKYELIKHKLKTKIHLKAERNKEIFKNTADLSVLNLKSDTKPQSNNSTAEKTPSETKPNKSIIKPNKTKKLKKNDSENSLSSSKLMSPLINNCEKASKLPVVSGPKETAKSLIKPVNINFNDTESVYYSDQNYDDDSEEGKLLIVDTNTNDDEASSNICNSDRINNTSKNSASEIALDLRVPKR